MYRQILVDTRDRDYQRILWRSFPEKPIQEFQLNTVTYRTRSAPYLALRVLKQLVIDEGENFPKASEVLNHDSFVDDLLFGSFSEWLAFQLQNEVIALLSKAKLEPRKWASNNINLIADIDPSNRGLALNISSSDDNEVKVLGIQWNPGTDSFRFSVNLTLPSSLTKRQALSILSKLFDPLGWISPVIIKEDLSEIRLSRWNKNHVTNLSTQLHGFADASEAAYGAVVYLRIVNESGEIQTSLIMSKTKVASLKQLNIHRLELQAAVLLAKLISALKEIRAFSNVPVQCWTDSGITLAWLRKHASCWKLFISNRVSEVHELLPSHQWKHVPTLSNPADIASRGSNPKDLAASDLWWYGPNWLKLDSNLWPNTFPDPPQETDLEMKIVTHLIANNELPTPLELISTKFSSWEKTLRVTAYLLRYVHNLKTKISGKREELQSEHLTANELSAAKIALFRCLQQQMFAVELKTLQNGGTLSKQSKLVLLNPFIENDTGLLRVGGRLNQSHLPYEMQHPILLISHPLVERLIRYTHLRCLHGGMKLTLSTLRQSVWLIHARQFIKSILHKCIPCCKLKAKLSSQLMAALPESRVNRTDHAFNHCGIDYAGPCQLRLASARGHKSHACYIAIFVCMAVKAVHLEVVSDYSSHAFIAAFKKFCSRRGLPKVIFSDRGTTFQGANKLLQEAFQQAISDTKFQALLSRDNVTWKYIPPAAPHFGGLWEADVKSVKTHLKRVLLDQTPTYEELTTLLCQIEAVLNSRPLEPLNDHIDDLDPLIPGHFLTGGPLNAIPQRSLGHLNQNQLSRWQRQQQQLETFWSRWSNDYLQSLQHRSKWRIQERQFEVGQMVLLRRPNMPPAKWNLARIIKCHPGPDGQVRVVQLTTATSEYMRSISELVLLPIDLEHPK